MQLVTYSWNTCFLSIYQPMTEAAGCWAITSYDSYVWAKICCSYSFPLIVSSVFLGGLRGVRDLIGMLLAHSLVHSALRSQHNDRMWCHTVPVSRLQAVWAEACWHLGCSGDRLPANEGSKKSSVSYKNQWREIKGSDGLFQSTFRVPGCSCVNMLIKIQQTVYFWVFCECFDVNFVEWMKVEFAHLVYSMLNSFFYFFILLMEALRIAWPLGDWPAGTLDMSNPFEDKSCWTVSLETRGQTVRKLSQKSKIRKSFSQTENRLLYIFWPAKFCPSASANSLRYTLPVGSRQPTVALHCLWLEPRPCWTSFMTDAGESGSTFCLARFQCHELEGVKGKGMEWGEKRETGKKELIFLTPAVRHRDVWACLLRLRAARKRSIPRRIFHQLLMSFTIYSLPQVMFTWCP